MDRALKERITGAVVLVAFAVLVVPVFLDGSVDAPATTVSEAVTLPGQSASARTQQTIVLERNRAEPMPSAPVEQAAKEAPAPAVPPEPKPKPDVKPEVKADATEGPPADVANVTKSAPAQTAKAAPEKQTPDRERPSEKPATEPQKTASATGMWAVQLGSFSNRQNAERLAADLRGAGFAAFLSQLGTDGGELHRVRIGPQKDRDSAESVAAKLTDAGHKGQVVPHP